MGEKIQAAVGDGDGGVGLAHALPGEMFNAETHKSEIWKRGGTHFARSLRASYYGAIDQVDLDRVWFPEEKLPRAKEGREKSQNDRLRAFDNVDPSNGD